ncbi:predicted protein [Thalassiosira pseudonana CCMP1335]|uniref:Uncharacterized protein n=1 Tax=Thalassiosira pseudonana TaxID=35128 RepID=B8C7Z5_THAPS|nr:predicted protein [Thalassiosira pseudonana CCMP1335]EED90400.1 predicted protein [Thalassiosira pseudonana CCMP1335]
MNDEISIIEHRRRRRKQFAVSTSSLLFVFVASCYFLLGEESSNRNGGGSGALYLQNTVQSLRNGEANKDERGLQADCIDEWHLSIELDEEATCTNSANVPSDWYSESIRKYLLHPTPEKCCASLVAGGYNTCFVLDACAEKGVNDTVSPTPKPTTKTTSVPSGTAEGVEGGHTTSTFFFYLDFDAGYCKADGKHDDLHDAFLFETAEECCASGWLNKDGCLSLTLEKLTAVNTQTPTSSSLLRPTVSPLSSVMVHNPTNTPSDCSKKVFHMSQDKEITCTNDGIYPDEWNSSRKAKRYLFTTGADCCTERFPDISCEIIDVCDSIKTIEVPPTDSPSAGPTKRTDLPSSLRSNNLSSTPSSNPSFTHSLRPSAGEIESTTVVNDTLSDPTQNPTWLAGCGWWHPSMKKFNTCENGGEYPEAWDKLAWADKKNLFYESAMMCCHGYFHGPCNMVDECGGEKDEDGISSLQTTDEPSIDVGGLVCEQREWHVSIETNVEYTCTNSKNFPQEWLYGSTRDNYLFGSANACCDHFFGPSQKCVTVDTCKEFTAKSTHSPVNESPILPPIDEYSGSSCNNLWHVSLVGGAKYTCTNDLAYPSIWNSGELKSRYLQATARACCDMHFSSMPCEIVDVCPDEDGVLEMNIVLPTSVPTSMPSTEPTTDFSDVLSEGCMEGWHPSITDSKTCTNSLIFPDAWPVSSMFRPSASDCCVTFFHSTDCVVVNTCSAFNTAITSAIPAQSSQKPARWWPEIYGTNVICVYSNDYPDWVSLNKNSFDSEKECCTVYRC